MKRCSRCGVEKPVEQFHRHPTTKDRRQAHCGECGRAATLANYRANREARLARMRVYRAAHSVENALRAKQWREKNPERVKAVNDAWRKANWERMAPMNAAVTKRLRAEHPERDAIYAARFREKHREEINSKARAYRKTTRGRLMTRQSAATRRARKRATAIGIVDLARIYQRDGGRCWICWLTVPLQRVHFDHVVPLARGGEHIEENIRVACRPCNDRKGARAPTGELIYRIREEVLRMNVIAA